VIGDPQDYASIYYEQGADELIYMDVVASLYRRSNLLNIVRRTASNIFVPLTVGGGIRSIDDVVNILRAGADKVAINTAAVNRPELISEVSQRFGSQCMVLSIEAKRRGNNFWEVLTDCGREKTGLNVIDWIYRGIELGAGEVLLTSIDQEGTRKGFDLELLEAIDSFVNVPIIVSGGYGEPEHLREAIVTGADAVAFADALHYGRTNFSELRMIAAGMNAMLRSL
jgi:cyclase